MTTSTANTDLTTETYYADHAAFHTVTIIENALLAKDTWRVRFACPDIARAILPGQFLMLRIAGLNDPLLARPFAFYDLITDDQGEPWAIDVVYLVVGHMTSRLATCGPGTTLEVWGPLGNGFTLPPVQQLILVAGGIGQTPFLAVAKAALGHAQYGSPAQQYHRSQVTFCYGARSADYLAGVADFERLGVNVQISTDDGSAGLHGRVTELLNHELERPIAGQRLVLCCGPERMMQAVAEITTARQVPCQVSLETPMACGIGICFSCVTKVRQPDGEWDYRRTCVEGPVFAADQIVWR